MSDVVERTPAQFFFEVGFGACWAEAFIRAGSVAPFPLTDALVEHAWDIAGEAHDDHAEFDRYLALADATANVDAFTHGILPPAFDERSTRYRASMQVEIARLVAEATATLTQDQPS